MKTDSTDSAPVHISIRISANLRTRLNREAKHRHISLNSLISAILEKYDSFDKILQGAKAIPLSEAFFSEISDITSIEEIESIAKKLGAKVVRHTSQYFAWYETIGTNGAYQNCTASNGGSVSISTGDDIYAYVLNNYYNGGSSSTYTVNVEDMHNLESCYVGDVSFSTMTAPTWAEWITELPNYPASGATQPLAKFGTVSFIDQAFENASTGNNISPYAAVQDNYFNQFYFESGQSCSYPCLCDNYYHNVMTNTMQSNGDFTNHYLTSQNTPGC